MEIVVTSDNQNPANFVSNFVDSINVNDGYEIAVKSIFSPPLFNFTEDNNEFTVVTVINGKEYYHSYSIKPEFYENTCQLLQKNATIYQIINNEESSQSSQVDSNPLIKSPICNFEYE